MESTPVPAPHTGEGPEPLRHAVLGAGGVGLSLAGDLARAGRPVTLIMREPALADYRGLLRVRSAGQGDYEVPVPAVSWLAHPVDVLWIAVRQPQLEEALRSVHHSAVSRALVVPLLNGLEHLPRLEREFGPRLVAGAIRVEARRTAVGEVVRDSLFTELELARIGGSRRDLDPLVAALRAAGIGAVLGADAAGVLWRKLALLAPLALASLAESGPLGDVRRAAGTHALMLASARELCAVAAACGAVGPETEQTVRTLEKLPDRTCPSLTRDPSELDAIGGSVLRAAGRTGVQVPATRALMGLASGARRRVMASVGSGDG